MSIDAMKQEPVAWVSRTGHGTYFRESLTPELQDLRYAGIPVWRPLYAAPPQRQPLTDAELRGCFLATNTAEPLAEGWPGLERFARAIERAHGIEGKA